ncbi:MAG: U32 family peptidase, partial [Blautia sp.]|nr:U32 family peptidase [Blautia sp.]
RAKAKNFSMEEMREGIAYAHAHGVKVHVTANILAHEADLSGVRAYLYELKDLSPDALIIADPGVFSLAREICPEIDIHVSTQANNTNSQTALFWHRLGAKRIVTARELSLTELKVMRAAIPEEMEMETFVHGAMCISYSGRCLLSSYLAGRDANQGSCSHPCRWKYALMEETRPGQYLPIEENERGTFIFNSRDLCMVGHLPDLMECGIDSFKIEGRMKNALYVATVARTYRKAIDDFLDSPKKYQDHLPWYQEQISECTYRPFSTGFFYGRPGAEGQTYGESTYVRESIYLGFVEEVLPSGYIALTQRNKFSVGEEVEIMRPNGETVKTLVEEIRNAAGESVPSAPHAKEALQVKLSAPADKMDVLRKSEQAGGEKL